MVAQDTHDDATGAGGRARRRPGRPAGGNAVVGRDQLLAAAERAIRSEGPDATMAEIASEATVTKPIVYRTIGDREALTLALSEQLIDRINAAVEAERSEGSDPREEFVAAIRAYLRTVVADRNLFLFVYGGQEAEVVHQLVDRSSAQMIELFSAARTAAGRDPVAANTWAHAIVGALQMVTLMWLRDQYCDIDTVADDLTQLLWPGVATVGD